MAIKIETSITTTLSAKNCSYENGKFFTDNEIIEWDSLLNNFQNGFDIVIKENKKEKVGE